MTSITNSAWRVRESCALALADVLRGRRWEEVGALLPELWRLSFRSLDDVKVRYLGDYACADGARSLCAQRGRLRALGYEH
jgi:hypothetical protein